MQLCPCLPCCPAVRAQTPSSEDAKTKGSCYAWFMLVFRWILFIPAFPFICIFSWTIPDCSKDHNKYVTDSSCPSSPWQQLLNNYLSLLWQQILNSYPSLPWQQKFKQLCLVTMATYVKHLSFVTMATHVKRLSLVTMATYVYIYETHIPCFHGNGSL